MRDDSSSRISSVLLEERRKLEVRHPGLAKGYQRFLKDFADYQVIQRQFADDRPEEGGRSRRPSLAARPK